MDSLNCNCLSIFTKNSIDLIGLFTCNLKVLSPCQNSILSGNWIDSGCWVALNAICGEGTVDVVAESFVVDKEIWVISLIFVGQTLKFFSGKVEVQHGKS